MKSFSSFNKELDYDILHNSILDIISIRESNETELYEAFDLDYDDLINEGKLTDILNMDVKDVAKNLDGLLSKGLGKAGLHRHKGKGLISYVMSAGKGVGKLMLALIKGDVEKVKEIAKAVKKEDVIDFLLKLDQVTQHLVTGPIHTLDAITGWHIGANLEHAIKGKDGVIAKIKGAIGTIRSSIGGLVDKARHGIINKGLDKLEAEIV